MGNSNYKVQKDIQRNKKRIKWLCGGKEYINNNKIKYTYIKNKFWKGVLEAWIYFSGK